MHLLLQTNQIETVTHCRIVNTNDYAWSFYNVPPFTYTRRHKCMRIHAHANTHVYTQFELYIPSESLNNRKHIEIYVQFAKLMCNIITFLLIFYSFFLCCSQYGASKAIVKSMNY